MHGKLFRTFIIFGLKQDSESMIILFGPNFTFLSNKMFYSALKWFKIIQI